MRSIVTYILTVWRLILRAILRVLDLVRPTPTIPQINVIDPNDGWPGTKVSIQGLRFASERDDNVVTIGGDRALVVSASPTELIVIAGESTVTGRVEVQTSGGVGISGGDFTILPWPDSNDVEVAGPPIFFHGPQRGTPQVGVANQDVLVILAYPTDQNPGTAAQRTAARNAEITTFNNARRFWVEATYGATSWDFDFTDWVALPRDRNYYFWQQEDIDEAREKLLRQTKRAAAVVGSTVYAGHQRSSFVKSDVSNPASPSAGNAANLTDRVTGLAVIGNRAYVTAGTAGLTVYDIAPATPAFVANRATTGWYHDVDADGGVAAVAAVDDGCEIWDISNPDSPLLAATRTFGAANWVTTVRVVGTKAYVGAGSRFAVLDVSNPASTTQDANVNVSGWVMDIDVAGTVAAVATDGQGVVLYDISGVTPTVDSTILAVNRVHAVTISGTSLYIAGADQGLHVYDISNPSAPVAKGTMATAKDAFGVAVSGTTAYLSLGGRTLTVVNASNPAAMSVAGSVSLAGSLTGSGDPDLATLQTNLTEAINGQALLERGGALMIDALTAATAAGFNLDPYQGIVVIVNGPFLRGQSWTADSFTHEGVTFRLNERKGIYYVATNADWGRVAHETGHWLGMWDIYQEWHANGTFTAGTAAPWCMAGNSGSGPLWCAHQIQEKMEVYRTATPNRNVETRTWSPTAPALDETFDIVAHDATEDAAAARIHIVELVVSSGLSYLIEVRQKPIGLIFDQGIPVTNTQQGIVVVTRVTEGTSISNALERPIMLFGGIDVGDEVVDAARRLTISVDSIIQDRPLVYRVRVQWNQPVTGDPGGQFDMAITPWTTDNWETVDMWVDSTRNNAGMSVIYENHEPGDNSKPILNGDRPWVGRNNKIYARIRNTGPVAVDDVYVTFYANSPPGIGDNGDWFPLGTKLVATVPGRDPAVPGSGETIVDHDWTPAKGEHTCLKVAVLPRSGEINVDNNSAQENVFTFDSAGASSHEPVLLETRVRSPFTIWRRVDSIVRGLPAGWHAVVDHAWVWTAPKATQALEVVMWTDIDAPYDFTPPYMKRDDQEREIPDRALIRVEGWTTFDHRYLPIGGILADIKANTRVEIEHSIDVSGDSVFVNGCLRPPVPDVPITVEIVDEYGDATYLYAITDKRGCFDFANEDMRLKEGEYQIRIFVTAGADAAETETELQTLVVPA